MLTYYDMLGVAPDASDQDIKAAYRKLVKQYHPDRAGPDKGAPTEEESAYFHDIAEAYQVLINAEKRSAYDAQLKRALVPQGDGTAGAGFGRGTTFAAIGLCVLAILGAGFIYMRLFMPDTATVAVKNMDRAPQFSEVRTGKAAIGETQEAAQSAQHTQDRIAKAGKDSLPKPSLSVAVKAEDDAEIAAETAGAATAPAQSEQADPEPAKADASRPEKAEPEAAGQTGQTEEAPLETAPAEQAAPQKPEPDPASAQSDPAVTPKPVETAAREPKAEPETSASAHSQSGVAEGSANAKSDDTAKGASGELAREARRSAAWAAASNAGSPHAFQAFLKAYPTGPWSEEARERLAHSGYIMLEEKPGEAPVWVKPGDPVAGRFRDCADCPEMVAVPAGRFEYRHALRHRWSDPRAGNASVSIAEPFAISRSEVTVRQWQACVAAGSCRPVPNSYGAPGDPVTEVTWHDARDYVRWLSLKTGKRYRLLSEAEWDYAARAASEGPSWRSPDAERFDATFSGESWNRTEIAAAQRRASGAHPWGLASFDGDIAEWVEDCWIAERRGLQPDGRAWTAADGADCSRRVLKAEPFRARKRWFQRFRLSDYPDQRDSLTGFRVARDLTTNRR